jgi:hypothetical protein
MFIKNFLWFVRNRTKKPSFSVVICGSSPRNILDAQMNRDRQNDQSETETHENGTDHKTANVKSLLLRDSQLYAWDGKKYTESSVPQRE